MSSEIARKGPRMASFRHSIVVSIPACHAGDQGSIPCDGIILTFYSKTHHSPPTSQMTNNNTAGCSYNTQSHMTSHIPTFPPPFASCRHYSTYKPNHSTLSSAQATLHALILMMIMMIMIVIVLVIVIDWWSITNNK